MRGQEGTEKNHFQEMDRDKDSGNGTLQAIMASYFGLGWREYPPKNVSLFSK
jgi:hypothetical protein